VTAGDGTDVIDLIANPIGLSDTPPACWRRPPRLGEHADELRAWLNDKLPGPDTDPPSLHPHRSTA
jgi:crotonobetainyl-CoA:carnitine CoA-transferase CaiB-like acyl-CoA transferase